MSRPLPQGGTSNATSLSLEQRTLTVRSILETLAVRKALKSFRLVQRDGAGPFYNQLREGLLVRRSSLEVLDLELPLEGRAGNLPRRGEGPHGSMALYTKLRTLGSRSRHCVAIRRGESRRISYRMNSRWGWMS